MAKTVGIDLGTTNSVVAYINPQGNPEVIVSREGTRTVPSVFAITSDGNKLVGKPAVDQEGMNPENTVRSIKRDMGSYVRRFVAGQELSPEQISAEILKKLREDAEAFFGEPVENAVITVPAYFDSDQRQATVTAGMLAGLKVLQVISEPTAAALAYGLDSKVNQTVLVYDLGGGTFDVTILKISDDGFFDVISTRGHTSLGGDDFDQTLVEMMSKELTEEGLDVTDTAIKARLRDAAENAKKQLSAAQSAQVNLPYLAFHNGQPFHYSKTLLRSDFETAIAPLIGETKKRVEGALEDARMTFQDIDEVVFVGGSTRVPAIIKAVQEWTGKKPNLSVNPDEAVALGAAVQASILAGESTRDVLLVDVIPLSLGVETLGGVMSTMIARNTKIPVEHTENFTTAEDNQKRVDVRVFQGERPSTKHNKFLGEFAVEIAPAPRGAASLDVTFRVDANAILSVRATDTISGAEKEVTISGSSSLSADEISRMITDAEANKELDEAARELNHAHNALRDQLLQVDELLRVRHTLPDEVVADLHDLRASLEDGLTCPSMTIIESLSHGAAETIKEASAIVYAKAQEFVNKE